MPPDPSQRKHPPPAPSAANPGESAFLSLLRRKASRHPRSIVRLGIGDDCAILRPRTGDEIVVTTDLFLEGVHFRRDWHQPEVAGHRCLARGLSDIAAMGATPVAIFLSFALPPELAGDWARRFLSGLLRLANRYGVPLAGGDTAQAPALTGNRAQAHPSQTSLPPALFSADIVVLGTVKHGKALLRSGARPGDAIYVTGSLGGAAAELAQLQASPAAYSHLLRARKAHPHLFPEPRLAAGAFLLRKATAAIDLSDGLSTDLAHLCQESRVSAEIDASLLPLHPLATRFHPTSTRTQPFLHAPALELALHGGEDYELLFTTPSNRRLPATIAGTPIHRIGAIAAPVKRGAPSITLIDADGARRPLPNAGWQHFRR